MDFKVTLKHVEGAKFEAISATGVKVTLDVPENWGGGNCGPEPKSLLLMSVGSCMSMNFVMFAGKQRLAFESLEVEVIGKSREEHPQIFTDVKVIFKIKSNEPKEKFEKMIEMIEGKYCPISYMVSSVPETTLTWEVQMV